MDQDMQISYRRRRWPIRTEKLRELYRAEAWRSAVLFMVVGVALALLLQQALLEGLRRYREGNVGIMNRVMQGEINADILVSGSSRAMFHYDPRVIEAETKLKSFNIGRNGTKLHEQLQLLKLYLRHNKRPAYLIQNLDMVSLTKNDDVTDPKQYIPWLNHEEVYRPLFQQKRYFFVYRWFPLLAMVRTGGMQTALLGLFQSGRGQADVLKGFTPQDLAWDENDFEKFKAGNRSGVSWQIDPQKIQTLAELIELSKKNEIQVVLVLSPDYREAHEIFRSRNETVQAFKEIAGRFGVPFWDYSDDPISGDSAYFYNTQHLNRTGAGVFSKSVAERLGVDISNRRAPGTTMVGDLK